MPKANLLLPNGTKVSIEGTPEDVARMLALYTSSHGPPSGEGPPPPRTGSGKKAKRNASHAKQSSGPVGFIRELKEGGFFKNKRTISDIQHKLEESGHIYALSSLSPALLRLVRQHVLSRIKEKGMWKYVAR